MTPGKTIRVLCWSERTEPASVYPDGINGAIASYLQNHATIEARAASINDPEQGIGKPAIDSTDVLIWWAHRKHQEIEDAQVDEIVRQVKGRGLGFIAIHSAHFAKIFKTLLDAPCSLGGWREDGRLETLRCVAPSHPIAQGIGDFTIPKTEMYNEPFDVPWPEATIYQSSWQSGEKFRSCNTWTVGRGRVVYFRPGHETYPIFFQDEPLKVIANSVAWCAANK